MAESMWSVRPAGSAGCAIATFPFVAAWRLTDACKSVAVGKSSEIVHFDFIASIAENLSHGFNAGVTMKSIGGVLEVYTQFEDVPSQWIASGSLVQWEIRLNDELSLMDSTRHRATVVARHHARNHSNGLSERELCLDEAWMRARAARTAGCDRWHGFPW